MSLGGNLGSFPSGVGPDLSTDAPGCWFPVMGQALAKLKSDIMGSHHGFPWYYQTLWWKGSWNSNTAELPSQAHVWSRLSFRIAASVQRKASPSGFSHYKGQEITWFWWGLAFPPALPLSVCRASSIQSEFHELQIPAPSPLHGRALSSRTQGMILWGKNILKCESLWRLFTLCSLSAPLPCDQNWSWNSLSSFSPSMLRL